MSALPVDHRPVATLDDVARGEFLTRVYQHLLVAVGAFVAFEALLINLGLAEALWDLIAGSGPGWLLVLGAFMVVNWLATSAAHDVLQPSRQYAGLFGLAAAEAVIFAPFLHYFFEVREDGTSSVVAAAIITAIGFAGLSAVAFVTRRDLSFLRPILLWAGVSALVLILAAVLFGLDLGIWFSVAMIALAGGSILYQTQTIIRRYPAAAYVGAAVQLFASVMLLFWYVLRLVGQLRD
ncbi:MAG TPA: Bax inhibitor-1 family protein [Acidimicrobiales bacterium]|jgi:FtsH-binding integral membrane protein|nr:Bax inhibitor-1 family protein [Acidimicrobiales bacterium]